MTKMSSSSRRENMVPVPWTCICDAPVSLSSLFCFFHVTTPVFGNQACHQHGWEILLVIRRSFYGIRGITATFPAARYRCTMPRQRQLWCRMWLDHDAKPSGGILVRLFRHDLQEFEERNVRTSRTAETCLEPYCSWILDNSKWCKWFVDVNG